MMMMHRGHSLTRSLSPRQDKLVLLLETGTSSQVRQTAAKQLAELVIKTFRATLDPKRENEGTSSENQSNTMTIHGQVNEDDAWNQVLDTISKILPLLQSKSSDARYAASTALGLLAKSLPEYTPIHPIASSSTSQAINLHALLKDGQLLLASAGREYIAKVSKADRAKRKKAMMGSLGLGGGVGWGEDVDKEIGDEEEEDGDAETGVNGESAERVEASTSDPFEGLSARQITMLKRKKGNIVEEANKLRRLNQANSAGPPGSTQSSNTSTPGATTPIDTDKPESVIIDPGAKARAAAASTPASTSGGAIEISLDNFDADGNLIAESSKPTLVLSPGTTPWTLTICTLLPRLNDPMWQVRHGAALGIMDLLRHVGASLSSDLLLELGRSLLSLLAMDRFGDFVGDTVIAPVRETAAQALGVLLKYLVDPETISEVHGTLMEMIRQSWAKRGKAAEGLGRGDKFAWEVRHAGLLGVKYEVAVRGDLLGPSKVEAEMVKTEDVKMEDIKPDINGDGATNGNGPHGKGLDILHDVVDAAVLSMTDVDDDVRSVAASALLPITGILARSLSSEELGSLLTTLWGCLQGGSDDLGSSTGAVMELLCEMFTHDAVMNMTSAQTDYFSRLFAFIRHPIYSVRLSVAKMLHVLATDPRLAPRTKWMQESFPCHLYQNLILEERSDIRALCLSALRAVLQDTRAEARFDMLEDHLEDWYGLAMTPIGVSIDEGLLYKAQGNRTGHNIDKPLIAGDLSLVPAEAVMERRLDAAKALALFRLYESDEDMTFLQRYLGSNSAHQTFMATVIIQEWVAQITAGYVKSETNGHEIKDEIKLEESAVSTVFDIETARPLVNVLIARIEAPPPSTYYEMDVNLQRIHKECQALLNAFHVEAKVPKAKIPALPLKGFTLATAQNVVTEHVDLLSRTLSTPLAKTILPGLKDRQRKVMGSIGFSSIMKERYDIMVAAGVAGALISIGQMPTKIGPVIKAVMDGVRKEEMEVIQIRAARSVAGFVAYAYSPRFAGKVNPVDKVVKNLFTFLNQDTSMTPVFNPAIDTNQIISLSEDKPASVTRAAGGVTVAEETEEQILMRVTRRGALYAFKRLADEFGPRLFDTVIKVWEGLASPLNVFSTADPEEVNKQLLEGQNGQNAIDALSSLRLTVPYLDQSLHDQLSDLFPLVISALGSFHPQIRNAAAKCIAGMCDYMTDQGMRRVVDHIVPMVSDAKQVCSRQGSVEAIHHIIKVLDMKVLPYILFLIVPVLGRMSDPDEPTRLLATSTFAQLIKMVPLEAGLPDPPNFSTELLAKRDEERAFLMQLLDGNKAEQYEIPISIKADLRQYQREGVSWLAFLAKYQLHGILCDDMGLGKSLQSICIVGSKHHERAARHKSSPSPATAHLPSLIVCPPTLTGHWYYEILKFTDDLKPLQYVGSGGERAALRPKIKSVDVVITSYETVRSDIEELSKIDWLYCVLDEGHIIKNAKTKLSAAVKKLKAQHRLLLSGTPIQNNVLELWSLFDFLMPGFLGSERVFNDRFSKPILADREGKATPKERDAAAAALEALHKQVLPFLLRRLKEDVLNDLPPKIIQDYYCDLSPVQKALYDEFSKSRAAEEVGEEVTGEDGSGGQTHVFTSLQYLRKLCNHPSLVVQGHEDWLKVKSKVPDALPLTDISNAPKLEALRQLLTDCGITGSKTDESTGSQHRVLIFCQLRTMLDIIESHLFKPLMPHLTYMRMDGSTEPRKRHAVVQTFNADPRIDVLLLTTSVGGLGLNLTGADTVIFVDHDWNPMKDLQAMDRAHRLGQKKVVNVYRLITKGTLEEKIMGLQRFKLNIASSVVTQQNAGLGSMNTGEVLDLFKVSSEPVQKAASAIRSSKGGSRPEPCDTFRLTNILRRLEDLPPEDEYSELSMANFMSKI
ncbi:hypothetical protein BD324DRAFT_645173 [Kockovaella imperatae]|uniref:TATA-binding protein-associated factor n=1 Tax=Kockovaella imperatae TaxID=4999 RepID=A0A1Y1UKT3_9TREE|nr:hypothetical protein BD324DRAFT_645173 [Kockovaella imperatae]ORX38663.1 hypothetical protein BD324DRAFT_645173 [Kockovaella imperatae]